MSSDHIIVGDSHARPGVDNRRFDWLGKFILDYHLSNPDSDITIIEMGDLEDMPSLSSYDLGKKSYEGRRYKLDIEAAHDARRRINHPIEEYNDARKRNRKSTFRPRKIAIGGNHFERRIGRAIEISPMLEGVISVSDGGHEKFGWEYVPFLQPIMLDGITYVHYWQGNGTAQPIGLGKYPAQVLLREKHCSTVSAHNHVKDKAEILDGRGNRLFALSAGCYLDPDQWEDYAGQNNKTWWKGIIVLKGVENGYPQNGYEEIPIEVLQRRYG